MSTPRRPDEATFWLIEQIAASSERIERLLWLIWVNTAVLILLAGVALVRWLAATR